VSVSVNRVVRAVSHPFESGACRVIRAESASGALC
jgi:hypothetical protein